MQQTQLETVIEQALTAARTAADQFERAHFADHHGACGFAWVHIYDYQGTQIRGNTKLGRLLKKLGITQDYTRTFQIWNPSKYPTQNVDTLLAGAEAAASVLKQHGFTAYAGSRLD